MTVTPEDFVPEVVLDGDGPRVTVSGFPSRQPYETSLPDLFASVPQSFFKPLGNSYSGLYWRILASFYRHKFEGLPHELLRSVALEMVEEILLESDEWRTRRAEVIDSVADVEGGGTPLADDARDTARRLLTRLVEAGWVFFEFYRDVGEVLTFRPSAARVMDQLLRIARQEEPVLQSYANTLDLLLSAGSATPGSTIHQIRRLTVEYSRELRILRENMRDSIRKVVEAGESAAEVLEEAFDHYDARIGRNYDLIKTRDNVYGWRGTVVGRLDALAAQVGLVAEAAGWYSEQFRLEPEQAHDHVRQDIALVREHIDAMPQIIADLDKRNQRFSSAASRRIAYLTRHDAALEGQLQFLIDRSGEGKISALPFALFQAEFLYGNALATPRQKRAEPRSGHLKGAPEVDEAEAEARFKKAVSSRYSMKEVDRRVRTLLAGRSWVDSKAIPLDQEEDYVFYMFMVQYGLHEPRQVDYRFALVECGRPNGCEGMACPVCRDHRNGFNVPAGHLLSERSG